MSAEQRLWGAVILRAVLDANSKGRGTSGGGSGPNVIEVAQADQWLRRHGRDFRQVCEMAGIGSEFIRDSYAAGRIDVARLRSLMTCHQEAAE